MQGTQPFRLVLEHRTALVAAGLVDLEACLAFTGGAVVKATLPGRDVRSLAAGGAVYYLKRVVGPGWRDILTESHTLEHLRVAGLPVPAIAAVGARRHAAALVTLALPASRTLEQLLMESALSPQRLEVLARRVAELLRRLHAAGINHRDFYCGHVLVDEADQVFLVDLGRAERRRVVPWRRRVKDLAAMDCSVPERIAACRLRLRFFVAYLDGELDRRARRRMLAAITAKSRSLLRHSVRQVARGEPNIHVNT